MGKFIASVKAILTRLVFACHGFVAVWQVTNFKRNPIFWYLCCPIMLLFFEGIFTLTIKANQEWKWFCPSVFLYLGSVVPAIWLLELDKLERRLANWQLNDTLDSSSLEDLRQLQKALGVSIRLPELAISRETWVTLIEQFLMLILIVGRWMLPKGELTRDQLSQLLLVYIGTAADIIEFFDSFKEERVARERLLVHLTLAIWSWSLLQFTVVLTATKSRKSRPSAALRPRQARPPGAGCCGIDLWAIAINMLLQDAPFLGFRLALILHYGIVSYMNVFFTCKNSLVILLQLYRLYVVQAEARPRRRRPRQRHLVSLVSRPDSYAARPRRERPRDLEPRKPRRRQRSGSPSQDSDTAESTSRDCDPEVARRRPEGRPRRPEQREQSSDESDAESRRQIRYAPRGKRRALQLD